MKKVLLAEDNSANRLLISRTITSLGYMVICASDGIKALHTLEDNPDVDCVLSDCQMPELNGDD
jgi:CheY-like chemotaxis protein